MSMVATRQPSQDRCALPAGKQASAEISGIPRTVMLSGSCKDGLLHPRVRPLLIPIVPTLSSGAVDRRRLVQRLVPTRRCPGSDTPPIGRWPTSQVKTEWNGPSRSAGFPPGDVTVASAASTTAGFALPDRYLGGGNRQATRPTPETGGRRISRIGVGSEVTVNHPPPLTS